MAPSFYDSVSDFLGEVNQYASPISLIRGGFAALLGSAAVAPHAIPGFEIKLSLSNTSLIGGVPCKALRDQFRLSRDWEERSYEYYDNDEQTLNGEGWAVRLRHKEDQDFELMYKKRWPITDGVHNTLERAKADGFDYSDKNYKPEIDWTYSKRTLSMQIKKRRSGKGYKHTDMPEAEDAKKWLLEALPGKLEHWKEDGWGEHILKGTRKHGPVSSTNWTGKWKGVELGIEILSLRNANGDGQNLFAELSFKEKEIWRAEHLRGQMIKQLDDQGYLIHSDHLKTRVILDRY